MGANARVRVLYGDTDAMGVAYYGSYLRWFEIGRTEWLRHRGMSYKELENNNIFLPVIEAHCRYCHSSFYDEVLLIQTSFRFASPARLRFDYVIRKESNGQVVAEGYTIHACVDRQYKVHRPPAWLKALLLGS